MLIINQRPRVVFTVMPGRTARVNRNKEKRGGGGGRRVIASPKNPDRSREGTVYRSESRGDSFAATRLLSASGRITGEVVEISRGVSRKNGMAKVDGNASLLVMHAPEPRVERHQPSPPTRRDASDADGPSCKRHSLSSCYCSVPEENTAARYTPGR